MTNQKVGLDYFPLDVNIDQDDKIAMIQAKYGTEGFAIMVKLYAKIYADKGYYYEWNDKTSLLFSGRVGIDFNRIKEIISDAVEWEIFDKKKFKEYQILTSQRIQKTYLMATKRRKKVDILKSFLVLNGQDVNILNENVCIIDGNADILKQSKVKESKEKKILKEKQEKQKCIHDSILNFWNNKKIIQHKNIDGDCRGKINSLLDEGYAVTDIKKAIHNYSVVLFDDQYFFKWKWTLKDFLNRGFEKFKDAEVVHQNYLRKELRDDKETD